MKIVLLLYICFIITQASVCPHLCSGHGSCMKNGICLCFPGWLEGDCSQRSCPYDHPYVDPKYQIKDEDRLFLECSGQGECDRRTGLCECYEGYEGTACQRQSCPNDCSNHGVCTSVHLMKIDNSHHEAMSYVSDYNNLNYNYWDIDQSFACVCDKEYTGYDCSMRKCPIGYIPTSDCDTPSQSTQILEFSNYSDNTKGSTVYVEYIDSFDRIWYTDPITIDDVESWNYELNRLPAGVIDVENINWKADEKKLEILYGKYQTGRQPDFKIITKEILNEPPYSPASKEAPGYHGMVLSSVTYSGDVKYRSDGIPGLVCSGNGVCDGESGICECFTGYYGLACTEQSELI